MLGRTVRLLWLCLAESFVCGGEISTEVRFIAAGQADSG